MALSEAETAAVQARLDDARAALHRLLLGEQTVSVAHEGEAVTFSQASEGRLRRYIAELETTLGQRCTARRKGISA